MGSIRPLITIAILGAVGVYLYTKINEGPVPNARLLSAANQSPDGVPPLSATKGASLSTDSAAPAWPATAPPTASAPATANPIASADATTNKSTSNTSALASAGAKTTSPTVPPIPDLPELPPLPGATTTPSTPPQTDSPANAATAGPPKAIVAPLTPVAANNTATSTPGSAASQPSVPPLLPSATSTQTPPITNPPAPAASAGLTTPSTPSQESTAQNPLRGSAPAAPAPGVVPEVPDRYGLTAPAAPTTSVPSTSPMSSTSANPASATTFNASWPIIQAALDRNDLKQAHQLLSKWHGDNTLSPADSARVESLLGQLAGTVIYSTEHRLEPARLVKPGETLESIAKEYNVPWQLLAKINTVQSPAQLRPGQELKVVRGPFSAVIDLRRNELALMIDDRYAGKFPVIVPAGSTLTDGQWVVDQKLADPAKSASAYATTPTTSDRTIILRSAAAAAGGPTLIIASSAPGPGLSASPSSLRVSPQDAEELADILSIGSRVTLRR
jgi:LysM repeat protein